LRGGCSRCRAIEAEPRIHGAAVTCGRTPQDIPARHLAQINRACTRWLRRRGLIATVSHTEIIEL
jgi:hypothetical protein